MRAVIAFGILALAATVSAQTPVPAPTATATPAGPSTETVVVKVCNQSATGDFACTGDCKYYSVPNGGCMTDPTDPWMSFGLSCQKHARCFAATAYKQGGCTGESHTNPHIPCGVCNGGEGITCSPDAATWLTNCTGKTGNDKCVTGCDILAAGTQGKCTTFTPPGMPGPMSVEVASFAECALVHSSFYHGGENNCSAAAFRRDGWTPSGECSYMNIDNEGTFAYAFECAAWSPFALDSVTTLPAAVRTQILRNAQRASLTPRSIHGMRF